MTVVWITTFCILCHAVGFWILLPLCWLRWEGGPEWSLFGVAEPGLYTLGLFLSG